MVDGYPSKVKVSVRVRSTAQNNVGIAKLVKATPFHGVITGSNPVVDTRTDELVGHCKSPYPALLAQMVRATHS